MSGTTNDKRQTTPVFLVALSYYIRAYLLRRQSIRQKDDMEHAILKQITAPTLEELEGEMPGADPFAPGADDTKGMDVLEQEEFMKALALRRQRWNDPETVNFDPKDIKEEKAIDSMVTGYLFTGTFEPDANKASVVAVKRHADLKRRAEAHLKGPGTDPALEEFHSSRYLVALLYCRPGAGRGPQQLVASGCIVL